MKKTLCLLAAFYAVAGTASAQTSVTVYGILDAGVAHENNGAGPVTRLDSGQVYGSRIGFRGTEDLGDGLSALFVLEQGLNLDNGSGQGVTFNRQAFVGFKTRAGTVTLGRQYTTLFRAQLVYDPFFTGFAGNAGRMISNGAGPSGARTDNSIFYASPTLGGVDAQLIYGFGEQANDTSKGRELGAALAYTGGPATLRVAYHGANDAVVDKHAHNTNLSGTYDFGAAKLFAAYQFNKTENVLDTRDALLGVSVPFGAGRLLASYIRKDDRLHQNADATQQAVGYLYALSKRTDLYTSASWLKNDAASSLRVVRAGQTDRLINVGIDHKF